MLINKGVGMIGQGCFDCVREGAVLIGGGRCMLVEGGSGGRGGKYGCGVVMRGVM